MKTQLEQARALVGKLLNGGHVGVKLDIVRLVAADLYEVTSPTKNDGSAKPEVLAQLNAAAAGLAMFSTAMDRLRELQEHEAEVAAQPDPVKRARQRFGWR